VLDGHGDAGQNCRICAPHEEEDVYPICTREVKAKRPRSSYHAWHARPCPTPPVVAAIDEAAVPAVIVQEAQAVAVAVADAAVAPVATAAAPPLPFPPVSFCYFA
jgi:hypothetical protein